ncbi:hypothetical protein HDU76_011907, partial [Blyttiomyces sp. JEL0837]
LVRIGGEETPVSLEATCICWSRKGKQLACGRVDGKIVRINPEGAVKGQIEPPPSMNREGPVEGLTVVGRYGFVAVYRGSGSDSEDLRTYTISQSGTPKITAYTALEAPFPIDPERPHHFFIDTIEGLGNTQHLLVVADANSTDLKFIGSKESRVFESWTLPDSADMPLDENDTDTWPLGLVIDYTATAKVPPSKQDPQEYPPSPILLVLNNKGMLLSYHNINTTTVDTEVSCKGMTAAVSLDS